MKANTECSCAAHPNGINNTDRNDHGRTKVTTRSWSVGGNPLHVPIVSNKNHVLGNSRNRLLGVALASRLWAAA